MDDLHAILGIAGTLEIHDYDTPYKVRVVTEDEKIKDFYHPVLASVLRNARQWLEEHGYE